MKITVEFNVNTPSELIDQMKAFIRSNGPILEGAVDASVVVTDTKIEVDAVATVEKKPEPAAKAKASKKEKAAAKELTEAEVRAAMIDYVNAAAEKTDATRKAIFKELLDVFGVDKLADLPADKYTEMVKLVADKTAAL